MGNGADGPPDEPIAMKPFVAQEAIGAVASGFCFVLTDSMILEGGVMARPSFGLFSFGFHAGLMGSGFS